MAIIDYVDDDSPLSQGDLLKDIMLRVSNHKNSSYEECATSTAFHNGNRTVISDTVQFDTSSFPAVNSGAISGNI